MWVGAGAVKYFWNYKLNNTMSTCHMYIHSSLMFKSEYLAYQDVFTYCIT